MKLKRQTMKTKHTPGPWKAGIVDDSEKNLVYCRIYDKRPNNALAFAGVYCRTKHGQKIRKSDQEAQWNAKLIAAAPELLEELQYLLHAISIAETYHTHISFSAIESAKGAVKKATS